jgi:integrase
MRRGELLGLQLRDFDRGLMALRIVRRQDNPKDPRRRPPGQKMYSRINALTDEMTKAGEAYLALRKDLLKAKGKKEHGFFFVASDGAPLSHSSVTELCGYPQGSPRCRAHHRACPPAPVERGI